MKKILGIIMLLCLSSSCTKDAEQLIVTPPKSNEIILSIEPKSVVLTKSTEEDLAITIAWGDLSPTVSNPNVSLPDDIVEAYIEFSPTEDFASIYSEQSDQGATSKQYVVSTLNGIMARLNSIESREYDIFVRLKSMYGANSTPVYSSTVKIAVTPFTLDMTILNLVDKNDMKVIAGTIHSGQNENLFEGFVTTSATWYNFFFVAGDGVVWGTDQISWVPFSLTSDNAGNCWFGNTQGEHYVYADLENREWRAVHIPSYKVMVGATEYTMSKGANGYSVVFENVTENTAVEIGGAGTEYNKTTGDSSPINNNFKLVCKADGSFAFESNSSSSSSVIAAKASTVYTLTVNTETMSWSLSEGGSLPTETYPAALYAYYHEETDPKAKLGLMTKMSQISGMEGQYQGFSTTDASWTNKSLTNFRFYSSTESDATVYGTPPSFAQYELVENGGNCWNTAGGLNLAVVNLATDTWSETPQVIAIAGTFNAWSLTANKMTLDSSSGTWKATCVVDNIGDGFKIVIGATESDWTYQYADSDGDLTLSLTTGNDNIKPTETGTYLIELTLNDFDAPTYTITKQ